MLIIVLEALYTKVRSKFPEELLYADDFALVKNLRARKEDWELRNEHGN